MYSKFSLTKRILCLLIAALCISTSAFSQSYQTDRMTSGYKTFPSKYFGFRIGLSYSHIGGTSNPESEFDYTCGRRTKLNIGFTYGKGLSKSTPLYLETGLSYTAKGGRNKTDLDRCDYNFDYLELPLVLKYMYKSGSGFGVHVFFGGYIAYAVGGNIKEYDGQKSFGAFDNTYFMNNIPNIENPELTNKAYRRFDAGLKFGVAVSYEFVYLEFAYDLGLANVCHNSFYAVHNRSALFNIGVNF